MDIERRKSLTANWGRFHATFTERHVNAPDAPKYGSVVKQPTYIVLDRKGRGKYVGLLLHVDWPYTSWWGEGDWLIWTDENGWPPSYHGTGTEEYFNSCWGFFDRKAQSGHIKMNPGQVGLYSFHLNDAFQFRNNIRIAVETLSPPPLTNPLYSTTAYWYALPAQPAESVHNVWIPPRQ